MQAERVGPTRLRNCDCIVPPPPPPRPVQRNMWAIVDEVQVPKVKGDFVLRWRWDTEQNPQIWTHCADVTIV